MKLIKKLNIIFLILFLIIFVNNVLYVSAVDIDPKIYEPGAEDVPDDVIKIGGTVYNAITVVGVIVAVGVLVILGIKYMVGSVEEKAEYKKTFIPYIIGAVLVGGGTTIINIIYKMVG